MFKPELLSPAGTLKNMRYAFAYGADAVYAGQPRYSLRVRNNEFSHENLQQGINEAHQLGKKFYVVVNIAPHNAKLKTFIRDLQPVIDMQPDALIMSDPGLIMLVREAFPQMPVHLSVQANAVNWATVKFWKQMGLTRVILSRELSLEEIEEIRQQVPEMEIEVFVHGALCMAYSGRCLLSGYLNKRDPNQGTCTNACRWDYKVHDTQNDDAGDVQVIKFDFGQALEEANQNFAACGGATRHPLADKTYLIEEGSRPGELMPIMEDEHGTYIMNSKDLRAVEQVEKLVKIGVDSLKIEGRTKSLYYVARTAQTYRRAIDDAVAGRPFDYGLLADLEGLANRGYTPGFLERHQTQEYQNYLNGHSQARRSQYVGEVLEVGADGWALIDVKNRFAVGDRIEVIHPSGNRIVKLETMTRDDVPVNVAPGNGVKVRIPGMAGMQKALIARLLADE